MLFDFNNNVGKSYEEHLVKYLQSKHSKANAAKANLVTDVERQKLGCDVELDGIYFDVKFDSMIGKTGNLGIDISETFDDGKTFRYGWLYNGTMTKWLVFYTWNHKHDKLIQYAIEKAALLDLFTSRYKFEQAADGFTLDDVDNVFKFRMCTKDGHGHKTNLWVPNIAALSRVIPVYIKVFDGDSVKVLEERKM